MKRLVWIFLLLLMGCSGGHVFVSKDTELRIISQTRLNADRHALTVEFKFPKQGKRTVENWLMDCTTWEMGVTKRITWNGEVIVDMQRFTENNFFKIQANTFASLVFGDVCTANLK